VEAVYENLHPNFHRFNSLWNGGCFGGYLGAKFLYLSSVHIKDLSSDNFNLTLNLIPATHYNIAI